MLNKRLLFFTLSIIIIKLSIETPKWWNGRRDGLKIHCWRQRVGSSPTFGTKTSRILFRCFCLKCNITSRFIGK